MIIYVSASTIGFSDRCRNVCRVSLFRHQLLTTSSHFVIMHLQCRVHMDFVIYMLEQCCVLLRRLLIIESDIEIVGDY